MELEEGDVVLCTVEKIEGTVVFVKIDETQEQGSIITSEIAPGRIRNLREYVVPKKKIVCKILKIDEKGNIYLSLRRVTQKEKKEVLERDKNEKKLMSILRTVLKDETEKVMKDIKEKADIISFFEESKTSPKELEKVIGKEKAKKIIDILNSQKQKKSVVKKEFFLKTNNSNGIGLIKKMLETDEAEIRYLSAGKYSIRIESSDIKKADGKIQEIIKNIEHLSKKNNMEFSVK